MALSDTQSVSESAALDQWSTPRRRSWRRVEPVTGSSGFACHCGDAMVSCVGCGELRCLKCDPYLSDDC